MANLIWVWEDFKWRMGQVSEEKYPQILFGFEWLAPAFDKIRIHQSSTHSFNIHYSPTQPSPGYHKLTFKNFYQATQLESDERRLWT